MTMRNLLLLGLSLALSGTACAPRWNMLKKNEGVGPVPTQVPEVAQLVDYLNDNANRMQTLRCMDLDVTAAQGHQPVGLRGKLNAQKPRNFRMSADHFGKQVVDLGSNDQEFWFWVREGKPAYQFYASYKDLHEGRVREMPLPIQPEWVMETFGMGPYGPATRYTREYDAETVKLVERTRSPQGTPVRKVIVFRRQPVDAPRPQVTAYLLLDEASGREICTARITHTQLDRATGAILPHKMELRLPEQDFKMSLVLDRAKLNEPAPPEAFVRKNMPGMSYDMARGRLDGAGGGQ